MALCSENRQNGDVGSSLSTSSAASLQKSASKWFKHWVTHDTVLNSGKLSLLKWVNDDMLNSMKEKTMEIEEEIEEEEYEVLYLCTFEGCGKAFAEQGSLRKHMNIHGEKQFICHYEGCGKRFMDSSKLKRHFLIHTGERHFVCPVDGCGKAFSLDFNLRSHMRTHTQENYHVCPFEDCRKRYAHEYKLRAHLRTYHEKVLPPDVKLAPPAPLPASLEKEIRNQKSAAAAAAAAAASAVAVAAESAAASTNHEKPFACHHKGCNKRYIHEYKLNLHLRKEHFSDCPADVQQPQWYDDGEDDLDESRDHQDQTKARGTRREKDPISIDKKARKRKKPNQASVDSSRRIGGPRNAPARSAMVKPDLPMVRQNREVIKRQHPEESDTDDEEEMENENIGRKFTTVQTPSDDNDEDESEDDMD